MRGDLVPAAEARRILLEGAAPTAKENVRISEACGRVLAEDLAAKRTQPPFPASAMDGYAVRHEDVSKGPAALRQIGIAAAGNPFKGRVNAGQTVRIFTGAPVPEGADTIVIQENATVDGDRISVKSESEKGRYVRPAGLDFTEGQVLLSKGQDLNPQRVALAAAMNHAEIPVWRRPKVALLATGDELVPPGSEIGEAQIIASNTFGLAAIMERAGGAVKDFGIVNDRTTDLRAAFMQSLEAGAELVVTTGGASVGDHDLVQPVWEELGASFYFSRIAMRPGKPMLAGVIQYKGRTARLLGLAGNPVSSLVAGHIFVAPLVARLAGNADAAERPQTAMLARDLPANDEREEYMRASLDFDESGQLLAMPFERQDSSMLAILAKADALVIRPAGAPPAIKGDACWIVLIR